MVRWRGWYYPTLGIRGQELTYLQQYLRFAYDDDRVSEQWQASYGGAFASAQVNLGDLIEIERGVRLPPLSERYIDFINIIWSVTEFFCFATTLAEELQYESLCVRIALHNIANRPLGSFEPMYNLWDSGKASMPDIEQNRVFLRAELESACREFALEWVQGIFPVFQWPEASKSKLAMQQGRLIERRW